MKKTITYREITIAIGVLVAMVIALTLWTRTPGEPVSRSRTPGEVMLPSTAKYLLGTALKLLNSDEPVHSTLESR